MKSSDERVTLISPIPAESARAGRALCTRTALRKRKWWDRERDRDEPHVDRFLFTEAGKEPTHSASSADAAVVFGGGGNVSAGRWNGDDDRHGS